MERWMEKAGNMLREWKGESYTFGFEVLERAGEQTAKFGKRALLIAAELGEPWVSAFLKTTGDSLRAQGVEFEAIAGARPNAPREDLYRLALHIARTRPDVVVALGGGSTIDAAKGADVLSTFSPRDVQDILNPSPALADGIDPYFGVGLVTKVKSGSGKNLIPLVAVQTAASSGAHLTKYSNITDLVTGQKKLIVDEAIVPSASVFDYGVTLTAPTGLTLDGGLDGIAHAWEVFMGATGQPYYARMKEVAAACLSLIVHGLAKVKTDPGNREARHCRVWEPTWADIRL